MLRKNAHVAKRGDASKLAVGIVVSHYNPDITGALLKNAREELLRWKVKSRHIHVTEVYGSFELPFAAQELIKKHRVRAIVALGCIIKGETRHDEFLAQATFAGLARVSLDYRVPVGLGVLTTQNLAQAKKRSQGSGNHGAKAAEAALRAALPGRPQHG